MTVAEIANQHEKEHIQPKPEGIGFRRNQVDKTHSLEREN